MKKTVLKACKCGSKDFYNDDGTLRCSECERVAQLTTVDFTDEEENKNEQ